MAISAKCRSKNYSRLLLTGAIWFFAMTCVFVTLNQATFAAQTYFKWDPNQTGTGSDGGGNWDATSTLWTAGSTDVKWANTINGTNVASFGNGSGAAGTITLTTAIWSDGILFSAAGSGDYTIVAAAPADTLTLGAAVTVAPGLSPTISAPIVGSTNLMLCDGGTLNLSGANTYSNGTTISNGTVHVMSGGTLGSVNNSLALGTSGTAAVGNLNLDASVTVGSISANTNTATANTITVGSGNTLTDNGSLSAFGATGATTRLAFAGGGNLTLGGSIVVGGNLNNLTTIDLSGLQNLNYTATSGSISVAPAGVQAQSTLTLANSNTITVGSILLGTASSSFTSAAIGTMNLGAGNTTINTSSITAGNNTSTGTIGWLAATTTGTLTINGLSGSGSRAAITLGVTTSSSSDITGTNTIGSMMLDGHMVNIQASTITLGASGAAPTVSGSIAFDTGVVDVTSLNMSQISGTASSSTLTVGSNPSSTDQLIVNSTSGPGGGFFSLANANVSVSPTGTLDIKGGTASVNCDITVNVAPTTGRFSANGTIILEGGTLNMMGHNIGGAAALNNVTLRATSGTLENVKSINSSGGLAMTGSGSLTLAGANTWTGPTSVSSGTMLLAANSTLGDTVISVASGAILDMMAGSSAGNTTTAASGATLAGTTGGATFNLEDSAIGTFTLTQGASFSGIALTLGGDTLDFDISNLGTDEILDSGPGKASVSGVNTINLDALTPTLTPGVYTLISDPAGGLTGTFKFANLQTTEVLDGYTLSLTNSSTAETLTVVPEPACIGVLIVGSMTLLGRKRRAS